MISALNSMYYPIGRIQRSKTVYIKRDAEGGIPYTIIAIEVLPNRADSIRPYKQYPRTHNKRTDFQNPSFIFLLSYQSKSGVEKYLSAVSGRIVTTVLPSPSFSAILSAAATFVPLEIPHIIPSSLARSLAV